MSWIYGLIGSKIDCNNWSHDWYEQRNWLNQTFIKANRLARQTVGIFNAIILMKLCNSNTNTSNSMPSVRFGIQLNNNIVHNIKQFALLAKWTSHFHLICSNTKMLFLFTPQTLRSRKSPLSLMACDILSYKFALLSNYCVVFQERECLCFILNLVAPLSAMSLNFNQMNCTA